MAISHAIIRQRPHVFASPNTMPRALKNLDISLGLAVIPVQLFTATSSKGVAFHLLHARCGSRIQMRLECPIHGIVPREETVRGYEIAKDEHVRFEPDELKALAAIECSSTRSRGRTASRWARSPGAARRRR
jgi:non-homologous end joining protein Ku